MVDQVANSWAARFLELGAADDQPITNMKLQKLVTLAESASMFTRGVAAFVEPVQAWEHGPVVQPVYARYKPYQSAKITAIDRAGTTVLADEDELIAEEVWGVVGHLSAGALRTLTHDVGPWPIRWRADTWGTVLPAEELGAAWPEYIARASRLTQRRDPVETPLIAPARLSDEQLAQAATMFRSGRPPARAGG
jgi:uncharacterized phage-associated protein